MTSDRICSERVMLLYEKFATLFGYSTWIVSVAFVVGSMQRDLDGMTLRGELLRIVGWLDDGCTFKPPFLMKHGTKE